MQEWLDDLLAANTFFSDLYNLRPGCDFNNADRGVISWSAAIRNGKPEKFLGYITSFLHDALRSNADDMPLLSDRVLVMIQEEYAPLRIVEIGIDFSAAVGMVRTMGDSKGPVDVPVDRKEWTLGASWRR